MGQNDGLDSDRQGSSSRVHKTLETPGQRNAQPEKRPKTRDELKKLYKSKRWQVLRENQLARHPWCQCPHHEGKRVKADVVDHIVPHRGDLRLFFNPGNLQSMTKACHDSRKQSAERGGHGFLAGCDEAGQPLDQSHHWHK